MGLHHRFHATGPALALAGRLSGLEELKNPGSAPLSRCGPPPLRRRLFFRHLFGAGLFALLTPDPVVGASGAIYGLLVAFAMYFPTRVIYMNIFFIFFFPIQAKYFVIIMGLISFLSSLGGGSGVSHLAHLGGLAVGYLYLRWGGVRSGARSSAGRSSAGRSSPGGFLQDSYRRWRMKRLRKKFEEYYQKRGGGPRYTIH